MSTKTTGTNLPLEAIAVAIMVLLSACSAEEPEPVVIQPPPVDPRFGSADALLATYNELITQEPRTDPRAILRFMYTENDTQKAILEAILARMPFLELDQLVYERFGECIDPKTQIPPFAPESPARITERNGPRAVAKGLEADGDQYTVHLVQIGDRWWISGYTFEYLSWGNRSIQEHEESARFSAIVSAAATSVAQQLTAGKITSAEQARRALEAELARRNP